MSHHSLKNLRSNAPSIMSKVNVRDCDGLGWVWSMSSRLEDQKRIQQNRHSIHQCMRKLSKGINSIRNQMQRCAVNKGMKESSVTTFFFPFPFDCVMITGKNSPCYFLLYQLLSCSHILRQICCYKLLCCDRLNRENLLVRILVTDRKCKKIIQL